MSSPSSGPVRVRASDPEREQVVTALRDAMTEGRLSLAEGDERMAQAYGARYRDELAPLHADLPRPEPAGPWAGRSGPPRGPFIAMAILGLLIPVALVSIALSLAGPHGFWPFFPLLLIFAVLRGLSLRRRWGHRRRWHGAGRDLPAGGGGGWSAGSARRD